MAKRQRDVVLEHGGITVVLTKREVKTMVNKLRLIEQAESCVASAWVVGEMVAYLEGLLKTEGL